MRPKAIVFAVIAGLIVSMSAQVVSTALADSPHVDGVIAYSVKTGIYAVRADGNWTATSRSLAAVNVREGLRRLEGPAEPAVLARRAATHLRP